MHTIITKDMLRLFSLMTNEVENAIAKNRAAVYFDNVASLVHALKSNPVVAVLGIDLPPLSCYYADIPASGDDRLVNGAFTRAEYREYLLHLDWAAHGWLDYIRKAKSTPLLWSHQGNGRIMKRAELLDVYNMTEERREALIADTLALQDWIDDQFDSGRDEYADEDDCHMDDGSGWDSASSDEGQVVS